MNLVKEPYERTEHRGGNTVMEPRGRTPWLIVVAIAATLGSSVAAQQDKAADVLKEMRKALGGDKFESLKTLSLEGPFQREAGPRQMAGTNTLTLQFPDRMYRSEETELPGGMSMERMVALNGNTAWEDMKQRGGMGGGMQIVMAGQAAATSVPKRSRRRGCAASAPK